MSLKTDYKDDIFEGSRIWRIDTNEDGTCTIADVTPYTQKGISLDRMTLTPRIRQ